MSPLPPPLRIQFVFKMSSLPYVSPSIDRNFEGNLGTLKHQSRIIVRATPSDLFTFFDICLINPVSIWDRPGSNLGAIAYDSGIRGGGGGCHCAVDRGPGPHIQWTPFFWPWLSSRHQFWVSCHAKANKMSPFLPMVFVGRCGTGPAVRNTHAKNASNDTKHSCMFLT